MLRVSPLALAILVALVPSGGRGEEAPLPPGAAEAAIELREAAAGKQEAVETPATLQKSEAALEQQAAGADADALDARRSGLPPPSSSVKEGAEARAALAARREGMPRWGLAMGGGFPDFATASLVFRPVSHVRLSAGPGWNYAGWGVQGGVALVPFSSWISPVVSLEGGRFFRTNLGFLAKDSGGVPQEVRPLLEGIDCSYAALDVGLELGSQHGFSTSIRVGLSYVSIAAHGTVTYTSDSGAIVSIADPALHGTLPSLKLGVQYWF